MQSTDETEYFTRSKDVLSFDIPFFVTHEQFKNNTEIKVSLDWMTKGRALYGDKSRLAGLMHASRWAKLNDMELRIVRMSMVIPDLAVQFRTRHSFDSITRESDGPFAFLRTKYVKRDLYDAIRKDVFEQLKKEDRLVPNTLEDALRIYPSAREDVFRLYPNTAAITYMAEVEYAGKELFDVVVINPSAQGLIKGVSLLYNEASKTPLVVEK